MDSLHLGRRPGFVRNDQSQYETRRQSRHFDAGLHCFFSSIRNNGCNIVECPLKSEGDTWGFDWAALERAFAEPGVKTYVLCNPHNPAGRVWTAAELTLLAALADKYGILVIADEIHGEFVFGNTPYTPYASVTAHNPDKTVTLSSASKTFNLFGRAAECVHRGRERRTTSEN